MESISWWWQLQVPDMLRATRLLYSCHKGRYAACVLCSGYAGQMLHAARLQCGCFREGMPPATHPPALAEHCAAARQWGHWLQALALR